MIDAKSLAIILAAGASRRMGTPKALLELNGQTFLEACVSAFHQATVPSLVVVGADAELIEAKHRSLNFVRNPDWPSGQLSSVRTGLRAALAQGARQIFVHPVDAPRVLPSTIAMLLATLRHGASVVVPAHDAKVGHPLGLTGLVARGVLSSDAPTLWDYVAGLHPKHVKVKDPGAFDNVNQPEEYRRLLEEKPR